MWDLSLNAHYLFPVADAISIYPLAGLGVLGAKSSVNVGVGGQSANASDSTSDLGVNLGGGIDYKLKDNLILNAELKYKINGDWTRFIISVGLAYIF
jgi:outer membrane protein X